MHSFKMTEAPRFRTNLLFADVDFLFSIHFHNFFTIFQLDDAVEVAIVAVEVPQVPVNFHRLLSREKDEVVNSLEESTLGKVFVLY